jgi:hypothetical protein
MKAHSIGKTPVKGDVVLIDLGVGKHIAGEIERKSNSKMVINANGRVFFISESRFVPHARYPNAWFVRQK